MSDEKTNASDFPAVKKARDAAAQKLSYYRRMSSMAYQITEPERTAAELQRLRAENERLRRALCCVKYLSEIVPRPDAEYVATRHNAAVAALKAAAMKASGSPD